MSAIAALGDKSWWAATAPAVPRRRASPVCNEPVPLAQESPMLKIPKVIRVDLAV